MFVASLICLQGCSLADRQSRPFEMRNLVKNDLALVLDAHAEWSNRHLSELAVKLYRRNPAELAKSPLPYTVDHRLELLFGQDNLQFKELGLREGSDAILLTFDATFTGDRVFALMVGLVSMKQRAYNNRREFFMFEELDQQKLYHFARNLEIANWRLRHRLNEQGQPWLLTNSLDEEDANLSFERLFGKLIGIQDLMARIVADKNNRRINFVLHRLASAVFLPI